MPKSGKYVWGVGPSVLATIDTLYKATWGGESVQWEAKPGFLRKHPKQEAVENRKTPV